MPKVSERTIATVRLNRSDRKSLAITIPGAGIEQLDLEPGDVLKCFPIDEETIGFIVIGRSPRDVE